MANDQAMIDGVIILAGGSGTRLWPASRAARPKQFMSLGGGASLYQHTLSRAADLGARSIAVVTVADQVEQLVAQTVDTGGVATPVTVIAEPGQRNTAPAIGYGVHCLSADLADQSGGGVVLVLSSDHIINDPDRLRVDVAHAAEIARSGRIATFGIPPSRAETGFGYIEKGDPIDHGFSIATFREKPDAATAADYLDRGYLWNSGMFAFTVETWRTELARHAPDVFRALDRLDTHPERRSASDGVSVVDADRARPAYESSPSISVDYALMERSDRCAVVPAGFSWSDVGSWDEVARLLDADSARAPSTAVYSSGSSNVSIYADAPVALCGVEDLIVVVQDGVVLVCAKGASQGVREIVADIESSGDSSLL